MNKIILAIESSCDETACAIVSSHHKILSNIIYSQFKEHAEYQGVVPEIASRTHLLKLDIIVKHALAEAGLTLNDIDAIGVTSGPGLIGGLYIGAAYAKGLALALNKPIYPVNHLEAHALTARLTHDVPFPYLLLLISGGHCFIADIKGLGDYTLLGQTLDDSCGEVFDKVAKLMHLPFPGGPAIEKLARNGNPTAFKFPLPFCKTDHCDFSFSGLKTAISRAYVPGQEADISASLQNAVATILIDRLKNAVRDHAHIVVAGGVAANMYIRNRLYEVFGDKLIIPDARLCTDNAAMIGWTVVEYLRGGIHPTEQFTCRPRWPLDEMRLSSANRT